MKTFDFSEEILNELYEAYGYEYCSDQCPDNCLYDMREFDELMYGKTPSEIARSIFFGDFNPNHDYFYFNGYANLESWEWSPVEYYKDHIDEDYFLNWCDKNGYLDEYTEEEEEEENEED